MNNSIRLTVIALLLAVSSLSAATHYVSLGSTNPTPPYTNWVTAATNIQDAVSAAAAGDAVVVTNGMYPGQVLVATPLALRSVNGPQFTVIIGGPSARCVSLPDGASLTGFTLTNGYPSGFYGADGGGVRCTSTSAFLTNCVITGNSVTPDDSGNGGRGGGAYAGTLYNCTLSGNRVLTRYISVPYPPYQVPKFGHGGGAYGSILYNCTLTGNSARYAYAAGAEGGYLYNCTLTANSAGDGGYGGGVYGATLYNCTLSGNSAGTQVGGALYSTLYNCTLTANSAGPNGYGGGVAGAMLYNCTLNGNSACVGGGAYQGALYNCIVYFNTSTNGANCDYNASTNLNFCCTTPQPTTGVGNITNDPLFVDYASGNLRLQSNSPCINAGNNAYVTTTTDLDGRPRVVGGTVDIGAYEFQPGVSGAFIGWLQQYGLPTDGSADYADPDHDIMNNWQEWVCGTCPTNPLSALCLLSAAPTGTNVTVSWQSVAGVNYFLKRSANLASPFTFVATNITGQAGTTTFGDTNVTGAGPFFYRVGVNSP